MKRLIALAPAAVAAALVVAGCGGSDNGGGGSTTAYGGGAKTPAKTAGTTTVALRTTTLGPTLVDNAGRTLYLFEKDKGTASTCNGACASVWPPLTTNGKPQAKTGVTAAKLGTTKRSDGKLEVTYAGHPLYYYVSDTKPGQLSGEGLNQFGATWDALAPSGKGIDKDE
jgi:predicted lipoprotein with Yx(FWY)xxD motif